MKDNVLCELRGGELRAYAPQDVVLQGEHWTVLAQARVQTHAQSEQQRAELRVRESGEAPSCSGTCSRRKEAAFGGARIIWPGVTTRRRGTARRQPPAAHADSGAATFHCKCALQTGRLFFLAVARVSGIAYRVGTNGRLLWLVEVSA